MCLNFNGLTIPSNEDPSAARRLLYIHEHNEVVILSPETFRSTFAQRFLLDRFDAEAYRHTLFEKGPFHRNSTLHGAGRLDDSIWGNFVSEHEGRISRLKLI